VMCDLPSQTYTWKLLLQEFNYKSRYLYYWLLWFEG